MNLDPRVFPTILMVLDFINGTADEYRELMGRFYDDGAQKDCQQSLF